MLAIELTIVALVFLAGLRASAFFSGAETGYYRLSLPRLGIDAQAGNPRAIQLMKFAHQPTQFVATTLLGNNLANFLTTFAISSFAVLLFGGASPSGELMTTLAFTPIVFLFGELLPKNLYFRSPYGRMARDIRWFVWFHRICRPLILPLAGVTRIVERLAGTTSVTGEVVSPRRRFAQTLRHGRSEGVLTDAQSRLANGALTLALEPVGNAMTPVDRVLGVSETDSREQMLDFSRQYGVPLIPIRSAESEQGWHSYVRATDLMSSSYHLREVVQRMLQIEQGVSKLETLRMLRKHDAGFAAVTNDTGNIVGVVSERGLLESFIGDRIPNRTSEQ